ncbi:MAG: hypothetical protein ACPGUC_10985 [Gammaproteobacteria bacterium]
MKIQTHIRSTALLLLALLMAPAQAALIHSYSFSGNANDETGSANGTVYNATLVESI